MGAVDISQFTCAAEGDEPTTVSIEAAANPVAMPKLANTLAIFCLPQLRPLVKALAVIGKRNASLILSRSARTV
jgi:hypothetical protein